MKNFTTAITRKPGEDFYRGLSTSNLGKPDYNKMLNQHNEYIKTLKNIGLEVIELPPLKGYPDAYFVEDTVVVTSEVAIITRPGAKERRGESESVKEVIKKFRPIYQIKSPGTLDGGDVLQIGKHFYIGLSGRTNSDGAKQLHEILHGFAYQITIIPITDGLHLKSFVNYCGNDTIVIADGFKDHGVFNDYHKIIIPEKDAYAANVLYMNGYILTPAGFPHIRKKLESIGLNIIELDMSEAAKMDGGLTCLSLRF
jgi:dimethylargininase